MEKKNIRIFFYIFSFVFLCLFYFFPNLLFHIPYISTFLNYFSLYSLKIFAIVFLFLAFKIIGISVIYPLALSFMKKISTDEEDLDSFKKIFSFIWWTIYVIISFAIIIGFSKLATSIGLIGLGLSLAFQKPILNIVGWFTLVSKQVYKEGDRIEVNVQRGREVIRGDVKEINLFHTVLEGLYKDSESKSRKTIYFPNEFVLSAEIRNYCKDSNYVLNEVYINLTVTSDYEKAKELFEKSITKIVLSYSKQYLKRIKKERLDLDKSLKNLLRREKRKKSDSVVVETQKEEITGKSQELDETIKKIEELSQEFSPKVHIAINEEGSIRLIGQYLIPYTLVKLSRTKIYLEFLSAIKNQKKIKIHTVNFINKN